jgi:glyoxylase-like metal-dependent hydrolase (beta-lactamase superfamily II)
VPPIQKSFRKLAAPQVEPVARGVWVMRGGFPPPKVMNVYLLEGENGITVFDGGIEAMTDWVAEAGRRLGGIERIVLGHGHQDHRGIAPGLGVPVFCHPDEVQYVEADDPGPYFDFSKLERRLFRALMPRLLHEWDGGPVKVAGTLSEGDEVDGFEVVHFPGHAPGQIGLWRSSDRLALVTDTLYTLDPESLPSRFGPPQVPHPAYNLDTEQARESMRKLADLDPEMVWAGHADPVTGSCAEQIRRAADA